MFEKDIPEDMEKLDIKATVGDLFEKIVTEAATIPEKAVLRDAVEAIIARETTRKAYVVDNEGKLKGSITMETLMRHLSYRLGARPPGVISFFKFIGGIASDKVTDFMAKPHPITRHTTIVDVVRKVMEERLNYFPVIDEDGKLLGELNSLTLLKVTRTAFKRSKEGNDTEPS